MSKLKYSEIMERVDYLERDRGLTDLQERARKSWNPLFQMVHVADLPEFMTRGLTVAMPSPRLREVADSLGADLASYTTTPTVWPVTPGTPTQDQRAQADKVERWLAVKRANINDGGRFRKSLLHEQLTGPYFVAILQCGDGTSDDPWTVLTPDPLSCFFPVSGSPSRPSMMARRYTQQVKEVESRYSKRPQTEYEKANLKYVNGTWKWLPLGDDRFTDDSQFYKGDGGKYGEATDFIWLDDGEMIYHVALNKGSKNQGEIVWSGKNMTGGCSALVVCGSSTTFRDPQHRLGPALLPIFQTTLNRNLIRSIRATKALNSRPDAFIEMTPEAFAVARESGMVEQVQMVEGMPNMIMVEGKAVPWAVTPDLDLDKLDAGWAQEEMEYVSAWKEPTDPKTVGDARANTYLTAVEAIRRRQTPLLKDGDWLETQLLKMMLHSVTAYDKEFPAHADSAVTVSSGLVAPGHSITLGPSDLNFDFDLAVTTKATTDSEVRAREEHAMQRVAWGTGTLEEVIEISSPDATQQQEKLAIDLGVRLMTPQLLAEISPAWRDKIRLRYGIILPGPPMQQGVPGPEGAPPAAAPPANSGGFSPLQPAAIMGPEGGPPQ